MQLPWVYCHEISCLLRCKVLKSYQTVDGWKTLIRIQSIYKYKKRIRDWMEIYGWAFEYNWIYGTNFHDPNSTLRKIHKFCNWIVRYSMHISMFIILGNE